MSTVDEQKLKKLKELLEMVNESLTREEFTKAFRTVLEFVLKIRDRNEEKMRQMESMHEEMMRKLEGGNSEMIAGAMQEMKKKMTEMVEPMMKKMYTEHEEMMKGMNTHISEMQSENLKALKEQQNGMAFIYDKVRTMKSGKDGESADEEKIISKVLEKLPKKDFDFESLKTEIKDTLKSEIENIRKVLQNIPRGKGMGRAKIQIMRSQNLTSQVDGVVNTFTLDPDTTAVLGVFGTQFPINFNAGTDWTFAGRTLTLETSQVGIPQSTSK